MIAIDSPQTSTKRTSSRQQKKLIYEKPSNLTLIAIKGSTFDLELPYTQQQQPLASMRFNKTNKSAMDKM